jgi:hypothetical protein
MTVVIAKQYEKDLRVDGSMKASNRPGRAMSVRHQ